MDRYYSLSDKIRFIDDDFIKTVVEPIGKLPSDPEAAIEWVHNAKIIVTKWFAKYEHKSLDEYAEILCLDFIKSFENDAKRYFPWMEDKT